MSASKKCKTDGLDGDAAVHVTVNKNGTASAFLDDQYAVFPKALQAIVANQIIEMNFFNETTEPARYTVSSHDSSTYESFEAEHVMHERTQETPKKSPKHRSMGFANLAAMVSFMESGLVGGEADEEGWIRVELETKLENPLFNKLHSLRPGDKGWGFDKHGGISLCAASRSLLYVQYDSVYVVTGKPVIVDIS